MRLVAALMGLIGGAVVALGSMPEARVTALGQLALTWLTLHWLTVLPWLTTVVFWWLWWRERAQRRHQEWVTDFWIEEAGRPAPKRKTR